MLPQEIFAKSMYSTFLMEKKVVLLFIYLFFICLCISYVFVEKSSKMYQQNICGKDRARRKGTSENYW